MKYILLSTTLILSCFLHSVIAQNSNQPLRIGDKLPDVAASLFTPQSNMPIKLSDIKKDKYLIIDFFATWCAPCIRSLENLNTLQNEFKDKLSIVVVTYENKSVFQSFTAQNKIGKKNQLPVIVQDTLLKKLLPYKTIPHEVWVDNNGIIRYISSHEDITHENLYKFINNESLSIKEKKDVIDFDYLLPLKTEDSNFIYRSVVTPSNPGLPSMLYNNRINVDDKYLSRVLVTNQSLVDLFYLAYRKAEPCLTNFNQIYMNVMDSTLYLRPSYFNPEEGNKNNQEWKSKNHFCYERIVPKAVHDSVFFIDMFTDLNRISQLKGKIIKKTAQCWILVNTLSRNDLLRTSGGKRLLIWKGGVLEKLQNTPLSSLVRYLNSFKDNYMIIDETDYDKPVDMVVNVDPGNGGSHLDIPALKVALKKYGLDLVLQERMIDMLYLTDKRSSLVN